MVRAVSRAARCRLRAWQRSLPFDWRLLPEEIAASKAHARMIAAAGVLTPVELETTLRGLDAIIPRARKRARTRSRSL